MRSKQLVSGVFVLTLMLSEIKLQEIRNGLTKFKMKDEEGNNENLAKQTAKENTLDDLEFAPL